MTRQTAAPLDHLSLSASNRQASEIARSFRDTFGIDLNPPYQRGRVWTIDQKIALVRSWITGIPTGVVILNDRSTEAWRAANSPADGAPMYGCIDGQQRISTAYEWFGGMFGVPASWFSADDIETTEDTEDGPYVRLSGLTPSRRRLLSNRSHLQVAEAAVSTIQDEAAIYLLVNGGGTPQTQADMDNAARIANPRASA